MIETYCEAHKGENYIDDITFNDLSLGKVFDKINHCESSLGDEVLYFLFRNPVISHDESQNRGRRIKEIEDNPQGISNSISQLKKISRLKKISCFEYLYFLENAPGINSINLYLPIVLIIIGLVLLFTFPTFGIIALAVCIVINMITYFKKHNLILPYLNSFAYISKAIKYGLQIPFIEKDKYEELKKLKNVSVFLGNMNGITVNGGSGSVLDAVLELLKLIFHYDIIYFYNLLDKFKKNYQTIDSFLFDLGQIDAYIGIIQFRKGLSFYSVPEFVETQKYFEAEDLYHPLIDNPVSNSIKADQSILLTGCNASGKSTFLRTVAINALLAQSINTVLAKSYKASFFYVMSSMSVTDDVIKGDSLYMAEIKALKRIVKMIEQRNDCLCFVDEVLKGTNTKERIAAGRSILEYLYTKALCFASTHDIELTTLLEKQYANYHFGENIDENNISFDYKLKEGPATANNAIKLLKFIEFPDDIVKNAYNYI